MRLRTLLLASVMAWTGSTFMGPARAAEEHASPPDVEAALAQILAPEAWLGGRITEADVDLLFAYLRAVLIGSAYGQEVPVPEELKDRAEALGRELQRHGMLAGLLLLQVLEARARQALPTPHRVYPPSHHRI